MKPNLIPFRQWCKSNGFGITTGYKILNSGSINAVKLGRLTFIPENEASRWANNLPRYKEENTND